MAALLQARGGVVQDEAARCVHTQAMSMAI
jgi:hypothetical protein